MSVMTSGTNGRRWRADLAGTLAIASLVAVAALWVANSGIQNLRGADDGLTSLGRLSGLLCADLLLLQVLVMARIPWVERAFGQDWLARRHRLFGLWSFWLLAAHLGLITLGYTTTSPNSLLVETWSLVTTYPGMLLAVAATGLMIMVVATSIRAARRRLRYESWHLLHLYAYLGVGLALPHQIWTGAEFLSSTAARIYWEGFYLLTLGCVLIFRLGLPAWRSWQHRLVVHRVVREAPGVVSVYLTGRQLHRLRVLPGQFFLWRFLDGPGWSRAHPYSLSAAPRRDQMRITVKDLGDGSARVAVVRPGTRVLIEGPYGALTGAPGGGPVVLAAAGVGITALRALLDDPHISVRKVTLLYRVRDRRRAVFARELESLAARGAIQLIYLEGTRARRSSMFPAQTEHIRDALMLHQLVPDVAAGDAYICGPPQWMEAARLALRGTGMPADRIRAEEFAW
jgi:predicted ferric reductase